MAGAVGSAVEVLGAGAGVGAVEGVGEGADAGVADWRSVADVVGFSRLCEGVVAAGTLRRTGAFGLKPAPLFFFSIAAGSNETALSVAATEAGSARRLGPDHLVSGRS